jgi:hypothetical protein
MHSSYIAGINHAAGRSTMSAGRDFSFSLSLSADLESRPALLHRCRRS